MPLTVTTTPGSASANSYASVAEIQAYFDTRIPLTAAPLVAWTASGIEPQKAAAIMSCRLMNMLIQWNGMPVDTVQVLPFPRMGLVDRNGNAIPTTGAASIPADLKIAQSEFAGLLLADDRTSENDPLRLGITSIKAGPVALQFSDVKSQASDLLLRDADLAMLWPEFQYASKAMAQTVLAMLVPSWWQRETLTPPVMFGARGGDSIRRGGR